MKMYLFDRDENATIDADSTISTFVADRIDSDRMCDLGIRKEGLPTILSFIHVRNEKGDHYHKHNILCSKSYLPTEISCLHKSPIMEQ